MGLYEDEVDWDADLFGQIEKSGNEQLGDDGRQNKEAADLDVLDDKKWEMGEIQSNSESDVNSMRENMRQSSWGVEKKEDVNSMRKKMRQSWGGVEKKEERKPTTDWMPGFGSVPDEDEPWFTG